MRACVFVAATALTTLGSRLQSPRCLIVAMRSALCPSRRALHCCYVAAMQLMSLLSCVWFYVLFFSCAVPVGLTARADGRVRRLRPLRRLPLPTSFRRWYVCLPARSSSLYCGVRVFVPRCWAPPSLRAASVLVCVASVSFAHLHSLLLAVRAQQADFAGYVAKWISASQ